jgi:hypothetical protein
MTALHAKKHFWRRETKPFDLRSTIILVAARAIFYWASGTKLSQNTQNTALRAFNPKSSNPTVLRSGVRYAYAPQSGLRA